MNDRLYKIMETIRRGGVISHDYMWYVEKILVTASASGDQQIIDAVEDQEIVYADSKMRWRSEHTKPASR